MGDQPDSYPIEHGFDKMKHFAAYYAGVYAYNSTSDAFHPWFPSYNAEFNKAYNSIVNLGELEGVAGQPATRTGTIDYALHGDLRPAAEPVGGGLHQGPCRTTSSRSSWTSTISRCTTRPMPRWSFAATSHLGRYSDSLMELDADIGQVMDTIREVAPNTVVILIADNGAWMDAYPDAGTSRSAARRARPSRPSGGCPASCGSPRPHPGRHPVPRDDVAHRRLGELSPRWSASPRRRTTGSATTTSRSTSTASTTVRTSSAIRRIRRGPRGSISTARISWECARTSAAIPTSLGSIRSPTSRQRSGACAHGRRDGGSTAAQPAQIKKHRRYPDRRAGTRLTCTPA